MSERPQHLDEILQSWPYEFGEASARVVSASDGRISIELHIMVDYGINIPAVCRSIISEVRYNVQRMTGAVVERMTICVDGIKA